MAGVILRQGLRGVIRTTGAGDNPASGQRLLVPKADGWYDRDSSGVETKLEAVSGTKLSALAAMLASDATSTDQIYVNDGGVSKRMSLSELNKYIDPLVSVATATVAVGASDTYIPPSRLVLPQARMQAGVVYECDMVISKSTAGTGTPVVTVRAGTAGTTADTSRHAHTLTVNTGVADVARLNIQGTFRVVGSSAIINLATKFDHNLATTGFGNRAIMQAETTSAAFDSTTTNMGIGVSINGSTAAAWTVQQCVARLRNLA